MWPESTLTVPEKETQFHTYHTYYVFATAKLCPITFTQNLKRTNFPRVTIQYPQFTWLKKEQLLQSSY